MVDARLRALAAHAARLSKPLSPWVIMDFLERAQVRAEPPRGDLGEEAARTKLELNAARVALAGAWTQGRDAAADWLKGAGMFREAGEVRALTPPSAIAPEQEAPDLRPGLARALAAWEHENAQAEPDWYALRDALRNLLVRPAESTLLPGLRHARNRAACDSVQIVTLGRDGWRDRAALRERDYLTPKTAGLARGHALAPSCARRRLRAGYHSSSSISSHSS